MKYSEIKSDFPDFEEVTKKFITDTWNNFYNNYQKYVERALTFLFAVNAGGAVATLSFMGASESIRKLPHPRIALLFFAIGIILVGFLIASAYHRYLNILSHWNKKTEEFYKNTIDWEQLGKFDESRLSKVANILQYILAYGAFASFILGLIFGGMALFNTTTKSQKEMTLKIKRSAICLVQKD